MADRPEKVRELVSAANSAMLALAEGTSTNEIFSAYFTLASHALDTAKEMGVSTEALQNIVYAMLIRCDNPKTRVM